MRVARVAWLVLLAVLLARALLANRGELTELLTVEHPALLIAALCTSFGQLALSASFWVRALSAIGERVAWTAVLRVTARSVPARYVPGSIWYAVSRAGMLRAAGVRLRAVTVTATLEALLTVLVSLALGGTVLALAGRLPGDELAGVAWVAAAAVAASPPVLNRALRWLARRRGTDAPPPLQWRDLGALVGWMVLFWSLSATTFTLYLHAFGLALPSASVVAGVFLVAWAVGFLTPFAPQGAGAFEVVFVALLGVGDPTAVVVVVAGYRALIGVRDAVAFGWGAWRGRVDPQAVSATRDAARPARRPAP
jgi:hypothetical protein